VAKQIDLVEQMIAQQVGAIVIAPCDVYATAEAMHQGLSMLPEQRHERATRLRWQIEREDISRWLCDQMDAVEELNL